jgi:hypothetical protein
MSGGRRQGIGLAVSPHARDNGGEQAADFD